MDKKILVGVVAILLVANIILLGTVYIEKKKLKSLAGGPAPYPPLPTKLPPPPPTVELGKAWINAIGWNGEYCLIGGFYHAERDSGWSPMPILLKFDGTNFTDLAPQFNVSDKIIDKIAWNSQYWLIAYSFHEYGGLKKYDGELFYDVPLPGKQPTLRVNSIEWNGEYWLIGSGYVDYGYLIKYDGEKVSDLTSESKLASIRSIDWVKSYWLIYGEDSLGAERLIKYDGATFTDLTPQLESLLR